MKEMKMATETPAQMAARFRKIAEDKSLPQSVRNTYLDKANAAEKATAKPTMNKGGAMLPVRGSRTAKNKETKMAKGGKPAIAIMIGVGKPMAKSKKYADGGAVKQMPVGSTAKMPMPRVPNNPRVAQNPGMLTPMPISQPKPAVMPPTITGNPRGNNMETMPSSGGMKRKPMPGTVDRKPMPGGPDGKTMYNTGLAPMPRTMGGSANKMGPQAGMVSQMPMAKGGVVKKKPAAKPAAKKGK